MKCDHRTIGIESTLRLGKCTVCGMTYDEIERQELEMHDEVERVEEQYLESQQD